MRTFIARNLRCRIIRGQADLTLRHNQATRRRPFVLFLPAAFCANLAAISSSVGMIMRVIYSEDHKLRDAKTELYAGELVTPFEAPFRAEWILAAVREAGFSDVVAPHAHGLETARKVHDPAYLDFLST